MVTAHTGSPRRRRATKATFEPLFALLALAAGCGGAEAPERTVSLPITPYSVASGEEMLRCEEMVLPSETGIDVARILWAFSKGDHHVHVYVAAKRDGEPAAAPYDCPGAVDFNDWHLLGASQQGAGDWTLPEGVAIHVEAGRRILIQTHYLNTGSTSLIADGRVTLHVAEPGSVEKRAAAFVGQNLAIDVPPHTTGKVQGECALPADGEILAMLGHHHLHGRGFQSWIRIESKPPEMVYDSEGLPEPVWRTYSELRFGAGDRLGWSCDYANDLAVPLKFGSLEATEEHCNLFAFHTRADGDATFVPCVIGAGEAP